MADGLRILGACDRILPLVGGAQISIAILGSQLQRYFGHQCRLVGIGGDASRARVRDIRVDTTNDLAAVIDAVRDFEPDVLVSALDAAQPMSLIARRFNLPHVIWMQSFEFCPPSTAEAHAWRVMGDRQYLPADVRRDVLASASAVLTNSAFMRARYRRHGIASRIMHPPFERHDFIVTSERDARYVTGVCGYGHKGADMFLSLAEAMPSVPFLLVGRAIEPWLSRAQALANVTLRAFSSPRDFLAETRVMLVPSQWPEPFGRIAVEAMANGIPTLVSRTGGLIECAPATAGVRAFRSLATWQRALTRVLHDEAHARALGQSGRAHVQRFLGRRSAATLDETVRRIARRRPRVWPARPLVALVGDQQARTAFAMINREWTRAAGTRDLAVVSRTAGQAQTALADVHIHHDFSRKFVAEPLPKSGHLVAVRTWDFGPYPRAWVDAINAHYDELWVMTSWIKTQAIESGIAADRVHVVPLGIDPAVFRPAKTVRRRPRQPFTFIFVGAPVVRKGVDILLRAYRAAFTRDSGVRLVIKTNPDDLFYSEENLRTALRDAAATRDDAPIQWIDRFMSATDLAALYRTADVAVFPYRAEGFCLPILESMACGTPAIVPHFGAALDFCSPRTSWLVPVRRIAVPVGRTFAINSLGFTEQVDAVDFCEMSVDTLAAAMQAAVAADPRVRARLARRGLERARQFTWRASAARLHHRIGRLLRNDVPVRIADARRARTEHARILAVARDLYLRGSA